MKSHLQITGANRLELSQVTLCAATSVNVKATVQALEFSLGQINFGACKLFTDTPITPEHPEITVVPIPHIGSSASYSDFILSKMVEHIETPHCLVSQWDGHLINAQRWRAEFLEYDYIGASWPQFRDGYDVGNGGFSLRSRRIMEACTSPDFYASHPEDIAIARKNRSMLEQRGFRFGPSHLADMFATERSGNLQTSFGYHGVFNMVGVIGSENFWSLYKELDDRRTVWEDFLAISKMVGRGPRGPSRTFRMAADYFRHRVKPRQ